MSQVIHVAYAQGGISNIKYIKNFHLNKLMK